MKIIIVGNGKVGYAIASQLAGEHHDITMVDSSPTALHRAENAPGCHVASRETAPPSAS